MRKKIETLDSLRAIACLGIFTYHAYVTLLGVWAVSVFFVMSGFLLCYNGLDRVDSFPRDVKGCARYAFKKTIKLYPLYFITMIALVIRIILLAPENPPADQLIFFAKQFVFSALLIQSWLPNTDWSFAFNGVGWYISTSFFLYLCFPSILRAIARVKSRRHAFCLIASIYAGMLIVAGLVTVLYNQYTGLNFTSSHNFQHWFTYVFPPFRIGDFSIGCLLGYVFLRRDPDAVRGTKATVYESVAILLFLISQLLLRCSVFPNFISYNILFVPSSALLIYFFALGKGRISRSLDCRFTRVIADYSVEIFLIHFPVIKYAAPFSNLLPFPFVYKQLTFAVFTLVVTMFSVVVYRRISHRFPILSVR